MRLTFDDLHARARMVQRLRFLHSDDLGDVEARMLAYGDAGLDDPTVKALDEDAARVERLRRQHAVKESTP